MKLRNLLRRSDGRSAFAPSAFPEGATMLFGIGAQKAGTTWLYDYLSSSPEVHFCRNKELHYFDVRAGHGKLSLDIRTKILRDLAETLQNQGPRLRPQTLDRAQEMLDLLRIYTGSESGPERHAPYLAYLLEGWNEQKVVADITPAYAILTRRDFSDMASIGQAKFVFIMRDPVSRMWSQIRMAVSTAQKNASPEALAEGCAERARMLIDTGRLKNIERADYRRTLTELEAAVGETRRLYVFYEDLFSGKAPGQICDFLGIDRMPHDGTRRVNEGAKIPLPPELEAIFRETFEPQYRLVRERFGAAVPESWRE